MTTEKPLFTTLILRIDSPQIDTGKVPCVVKSKKQTI